jgi:small-conductance mechanosensitive channel
VANLVRFFAVTAYRKRSLLPVGERDNFILGVDALSALVVFLITAGSSFVVFDVAFQTFFASISVVAVALVLIFRDYISNYLDSFRLMFSTDYRIGDYIRVGEFTKGVITDVHFRATKLKTDEGDVLFIPNTKLMTSEVINYSKTKFKRIIVPFSLPTESLLSIETFEKKLKQALLTQFPERVKENKMFLRIENMKQWQTDCKFEISVDQYNFSIEEQITKAVYLAVLQSQKKMKTPQIVVT